MSDKPTRLHRVMRISEQDREAIKKLNAPPNDNQTRYQALSELVSIIPTLKLKSEKNAKRPIRLSNPAELHEALLKAKKKSKQPYVAILLAAIHAKIELQTKPKRGRPRKQT